MNSRVGILFRQIVDWCRQFAGSRSGRPAELLLGRGRQLERACSEAVHRGLASGTTSRWHTRAFVTYTTKKVRLTVSDLPDHLDTMSQANLQVPGSKLVNLVSMAPTIRRVFSTPPQRIVNAMSGSACSF